MQSASKAELAYRRSGGIEVTLLWDRHTDEVTVAVADLTSDESFELEAAPEEAMAVFHHPYAYAALGGLRSRRGTRAAA